MSTPKLYATATARANRAEDGLRQIEDIVGRCVSNSGLESNVVEMVGKLADKHDALQRENAKLRELMRERDRIDGTVIWDRNPEEVDAFRQRWIDALQ